MLRYRLITMLLAAGTLAPALAQDSGGVRLADEESERQRESERNFGVRAVDGSEPLPDWHDDEVPPGMVLVRFDEADLATEVLPELARQSGVELEWDGPPREITLRLTEPVEVEDAIDLLCRFNDLHVTETASGIELRDKWGGELDGDYEEIEEQLPSELTLPAGAPRARRPRGMVRGRKAISRLRASGRRAVRRLSGRGEARVHAKDYRMQAFSGRFRVARIQGRTQRGSYRRFRTPRLRAMRLRPMRMRTPRFRSMERQRRTPRFRSMERRRRTPRFRTPRVRQRKGRVPRFRSQQRQRRTPRFRTLRLPQRRGR